MESFISYCGLDCSTCTIYLVVREKNLTRKNEMISEIIRACKEHYNIDYKTENIKGCDGCRTISGNLFKGCLDCKVRNCAVQKGVESCANCEDFVCSNLLETFGTDNSAKERLEKMRTDFFNN